MIDRYFSSLGETMARESRLMADVYRHPGKLGENREALLGRFLDAYLPRRYGVGTGFALFGSDLSTQQDVVVYDRIDNPVLFPDSAAPLFPPSALHALIEVKSRLTRRELVKTARKAARFKRELRRSFANHPEPPKLEALAMLFVFGSALEPARILGELKSLEEDEGVDMRDRVDMVCALGQGVVLGGSLMSTTRGGSSLRDDSRTRQQRLAVEVSNSLFVFYARLLDYIATRPLTRPHVMSYLPPETPMGVVVAVG
jgi:Domain of unknown function (DUF6602)